MVGHVGSEPYDRGVVTGARSKGKGGMGDRGKGGMGAGGNSGMGDGGKGGMGDGGKGGMGDGGVGGGDGSSMGSGGMGSGGMMGGGRTGNGGDGIPGEGGVVNNPELYARAVPTFTIRIRYHGSANLVSGKLLQMRCAGFVGHTMDDVRSDFIDQFEEACSTCVRVTHFSELAHAHYKSITCMHVTYFSL